MGSELRSLIDTRATALQTVAATMRQVLVHYRRQDLLGPELAAALETQVAALEACAQRAVPVRQALLCEEVSPRAFMALMVNTLVRVLPTYAEIPLNLALHGAQGDLRNYGLIALNVNDEAGGGDPEKTHPTLFNRAAAALAAVFGVPAVSIRIGRAALILKACEGRWATADEARDLVASVLRQDELGNPLSEAELARAVATAAEYAPLIAPEALECYQWRMRTFAELVSRQLLDFGRDHQAYVAMAGLLAVREAAASDPQGIFHSLTSFVLRYAGHLAADRERLRHALDWSDVHADEAMGELAGYQGHSVEDDHAEQALGAVLDHIHGPQDLETALVAMNGINHHRMALWEGTVRVMAAQTDAPVKPLPVPAAAYQRVREDRERATERGGEGIAARVAAPRLAAGAGG